MTQETWPTFCKGAINSSCSESTPIDAGSRLHVEIKPVAALMTAGVAPAESAWASAVKLVDANVTEPISRKTGRENDRDIPRKTNVDAKLITLVDGDTSDASNDEEQAVTSTLAKLAATDPSSDSILDMTSDPQDSSLTSAAVDFFNYLVLGVESEHVSSLRSASNQNLGAQGQNFDGRVPTRDSETDSAQDEEANKSLGSDEKEGSEGKQANAVGEDLPEGRPSRHLWLGNIPLRPNKAAIEILFGAFGPLDSVRVFPGKMFAFVNFQNPIDAVRAKAALDGQSAPAISGSKAMAVRFQKDSTPGDGSVEGQEGRRASDGVDIDLSDMSILDQKLDPSAIANLTQLLELDSQVAPSINLSNRLNPNNVHFDKELAVKYKYMSKLQKESLWAADRAMQQASQLPQEGGGTRSQMEQNTCPLEQLVDMVSGDAGHEDLQAHGLGHSDARLIHVGGQYSSSMLKNTSTHPANVNVNAFSLSGLSLGTGMSRESLEDIMLPHQLQHGLQQDIFPNNLHASQEMLSGQRLGLLNTSSAGQLLKSAQGYPHALPVSSVAGYANVGSSLLLPRGGGPSSVPLPQPLPPLVINTGIGAPIHGHSAVMLPSQLSKARFQASLQGGSVLPRNIDPTNRMLLHDTTRLPYEMKSATAYSPQSQPLTQHSVLQASSNSQPMPSLAGPHSPHHVGQQMQLNKFSMGPTGPMGVDSNAISGLDISMQHLAMREGMYPMQMMSRLPRQNADMEDSPPFQGHSLQAMQHMAYPDEMVSLQSLQLMAGQQQSFVEPPFPLQGLQVPSQMCCPLTGKIMVEPVMAADGITYEKQAISAWLSNSCTSPITGKPLANRYLAFNSSLHAAIQSQFSSVMQ